MNSYNHKNIEKKWQERWKEDKAFKTPNLHLGGVEGGRKMYVLDMFPYPSGSGLHVGHPKGYIATDIYSRYHRMKGYSVLHPMGWDAFGLPAENYALEKKVHPRKAVEANIKHFKEQLESIGFDYDWEREINTTDPDYYKWTQWIFLQLFKKGLAYESNEPVNWCPKDKTVLSNEDVEDGKCERCGTPVEQRPMRQWVLKITAYADKLLDDLKDLDWPESIKISQENWIGRSEGALIKFEILSTKSETVEVFTTRPDTIFGATYMVFAPEHKLIEELKNEIQNYVEVRKYVEQAENKTELQRKEEEKEKTGVELKGIVAINPANDEKISVWVADYVLSSYGTGAIMAVPAHDERDHEFALKFGLPIKHVVDIERETAKQKMTAWLEQKGVGKKAVTHKLKDWVFSRQRYWGEPIPIIHCEKCGVVPVPEKDLPVKLPEVEHFEPTGTGESPLANIDSWVNVTCPACAGAARRETNTMPQWAGSSWYYLRYIDPKNKKKLVDQKKEKVWMPVDMYVGGAEHATRHLIYARFWHRFLYDEGHVSTPEPFMKLQQVGLIAGEDGKKLSKRSGNAISPDEIVEKYGADAFRLFEMFMGPFNQGAQWSTPGMQGTHRFIKRVWNEFTRVRLAASPPRLPPALMIKLQQTIKRVTESTENFRFNTAVSAFMEFLNELEKEKGVSKNILETYVLLLAPYTPHLAEELWEKLGHKQSLVKEKWPKWDEKILAATQVTIPIQVNGKVRATVTANRGLSQADLESLARAQDNVAKHLFQSPIIKIIYIPDKLLNFVT